MGVFDKIKSAIWGSDEPEASTETASITPSAGASPVTASTTGAAPKAATPPAAVAPSPQAKAAAPAAAPVDVAAMLDAAVVRNGQKLDWRHSIVDLMKALDLDSSLSNRKELAKELNYPGDTSDSAKMNMWLHKALMSKLAENGGTVPQELLD